MKAVDQGEAGDETENTDCCVSVNQSLNRF